MVNTTVVAEKENISNSTALDARGRDERQIYEFYRSIAEVIKEGLNPDVVEKLLNVRKQIQEEVAKQEFFKALSLFQTEVPEIPKDRFVLNRDGTVRYRYTTFSDITKRIKPYLRKYGLSYRFETRSEDNAIVVTCYIHHILGYETSSTFKAQIPKDNPGMSDIQKWISALSYARKYALTLALGLVLDEVESEEELNPGHGNSYQRKEKTAEVLTFQSRETPEGHSEKHSSGTSQVKGQQRAQLTEHTKGDPQHQDRQIEKYLSRIREVLGAENEEELWTSLSRMLKRPVTRETLTLHDVIYALDLAKKTIEPF